MFLLFLSILLVLSFGGLIEAGMKTLCTTTPAKDGEETLISCHFDTDVTIFQEDVIVFKVDKEQPVLMLAWYDGKPNITTERGYECDGKISDHIIIKIPKANPDHAGEYKCIVPPNGKGDARGCTLNISGTNNVSLLTTFLTSPTSKLTEVTKGTDEHPIIAIIAIILGVTLGVVIIVFAVVVFRKTWKRFLFKREQQENSTIINQAEKHPLSSSKKKHKKIFEKQTFLRIQRHEHNGAYKDHPTCLQKENGRNYQVK